MRFAASALMLVVGCGAAPAAPAARQPGAPADSSCVAAFDSLQAILRRDYAAYRDKVRGREAALAALADSVRATARTSDRYDVCIPALQRWTRFFRDPHMVGPWQAAPPAPAGAPAASGAAPHGVRIDWVGLEAEARIPPEAPDTIGFALGYLRSGRRLR